MIVEINPPASGASLTSVVSGPSPVTVYSDAGLSSAVSLPLALPQYGSTTVYFAAVGRWDATVASGSGGTVWRGGGVAGATQTLTFRSVLGTGLEDVGQVIDGGSA